MTSAGRHKSDALIGAPGSGTARYLASQTVRGLLIAAISGGLFWLVWIYGNGLRDPRYLDGWVLAGGMGLQLYFHAGIKMGSLSPKSAMRWRKLHIFVGYLLIAAFISHSDFSLPDTSFEWALWAGFVIVTRSPGPVSARIHDREPLIVPPSLRDLWLSRAPLDEVLAALAAFTPDLEAWEVGSRVGSTKIDEPGLRDAIGPPP